MQGGCTIDRVLRGCTSFFCLVLGEASRARCMFYKAARITDPGEVAIGPMQSCLELLIHLFLVGIAGPGDANNKLFHVHVLRTYQSNPAKYGWRLGVYFSFNHTWAERQTSRKRSHKK